MTPILFILIMCIVAASNAASPVNGNPLSIVIDSDSESVESESPATTSVPSSLQLRRRVSFNIPHKAGAFKPLRPLTETDHETDDDNDGEQNTVDEVIQYIRGDTERGLFETELVPVAGDAALMLALEGKNVIMTGEDAMNLVLVSIGSCFALYGWSIFSVWLYNYFTSL